MNRAHAVPASRPVIDDVRSCEQWLAGATLADSRQACRAFIELLDDIEDAPPRNPVYLEILERLRRPIRVALEDQTRRFFTRPLPLASAEEQSFIQTCDLWLALLRAWQRLQHAAEEHASEIGLARPALALRVIESAAGLIGVYFAARREVAPGLWRWLHQGYIHAERHHVAETEITQPGGEVTSCAAVYSELLMTSLAHPYGLGQRELGWMRGWAHRWSHKMKLWRSAENGGGPAVDLEGDSGPQWTAAGVPGASIRFIDCSEIGRSIRRRLRRPEQAAAPAELGAGHECVRTAVDELLRTMARCWSDVQPPREFPRRPASSRTELAAGMEAIYESIADKVFRDSDSPWMYSRREAEQLHIFQRAIDHEQKRSPSAERESWEIVDESANGFQLVRKASGARIAIRQLIALRPDGARNFILCEVRWLKQGKNGALSIGVKALPGLPQPCALRPLERNSGRASWIPAFLLPIAMSVAPTLAVPAGAYNNRREAELKLENQVMKIRFNGLLRHGHDFDWVNFAAEG